MCTALMVATEPIHVGKEKYIFHQCAFFGLLTKFNVFLECTDMQHTEQFFFVSKWDQFSWSLSSSSSNSGIGKRKIAATPVNWSSSEIAGWCRLEKHVVTFLHVTYFITVPESMDHSEMLTYVLLRHAYWRISWLHLQIHEHYPRGWRSVSVASRPGFWKHHTVI